MQDSSTEPYLYFQGLLKLAKDVQGAENVHMGVRPYGFHAGNVLALVAYPYLLCKYTEKEGKTARFNFVVSINDWEQDALDGPDYRKFPFNIYPKNTSIFYLSDEKGCCSSAVNHWMPIIWKNIEQLQQSFPQVSFTFVKNSELISYEFCRKMLIRTIADPYEQLEILKENTEFEVLESPVSYGGAICPKCHLAKGETKVLNNGEKIRWTCGSCGYGIEGKMEDFQYWWYHKPMLLARLNIFDIDITLSGGDHYNEGDFNVRRAFIRKFSPLTKEPRMLFTPTLLALNGQKMSKSRNNTEFADITKLIDFVDRNEEAEIPISEELILRNIDEKDYCYSF